MEGNSLELSLLDVVELTSFLDVYVLVERSFFSFFTLLVLVE